jgi:ribosomal protein S8E
MTAEQAVNWAEQHLFERRSVVHEHEVWRHALEHTRGQTISLPEIKAVTRRREYLRDEQFQGKITTREVFEREYNIVRLAQHQMRQYEPLAANYQPSNRSLDDEQSKAVKHILSSRDFVTLFRGGAGTGKSFTLREVKAGLIQAGHIVQVLAPQRQQVADLERDGFTGAQTVSALLKQNCLTRGTVVLVDEAGQIGGQHPIYSRDDLDRFLRETSEPIA